MEDELNLDLDTIETNVESKLKVKNRFEQLSEKVILTAKERDEKAQLAEKLSGENQTISKERDFYKDFAVQISKYPAAAEFQDKILEKVKGGYSTEDALLVILAKEGKLNTAPQPEHKEVPHVEGGSASTVIPGNKSLSDMNVNEKFDALKELDKTGDLERILKGGK